MVASRNLDTPNIPRRAWAIAESEGGDNGLGEAQWELDPVVASRDLGLNMLRHAAAAAAG